MRSTYWRLYHIGAVCLDQRGTAPFWRVNWVAFGAGLLLIGQELTVLISLGFTACAIYPLVQMVSTTTAVCFRFGFSNPALSAAASNAAGKETMGGARSGLRVCFAWTGWWPCFSWTPVSARWSAFSFWFGVCITSLLLFIMIVLKRRPAMQLSAANSNAPISRLADDRHALPSFPAGANTAIKFGVIADHGDFRHCIRSITN